MKRKRTTKRTIHNGSFLTETHGEQRPRFLFHARELRKTVDPNLIRQRAGRRDRNGHVHMVEYVEWHTVADILDEHAPNWGTYGQGHSPDRRHRYGYRRDHHRRRHSRGHRHRQGDQARRASRKPSTTR